MEGKKKIKHYSSSNCTRIILLVSFLVSLITILIYLPALNNGFVKWDDYRYIYNNTHIQSLNIDSLKWMFTTFHASNWHPLTWLSHAFDYFLWDLNPLGHHLSSMLLHFFNTFLVFLLTMRLMNYAQTGDKLDILSASEERDQFFIRNLLAATITGLLFGLHPLHVESVVWVSERKDVLCAFFFLLTIISYTQYLSSRRLKYYFISFILFLLALMSKPMAVTLPMVLIIIDFYPYERICRSSKPSNSPLTKAEPDWTMVLWEKLPFFIATVLSSIITIMAQKAGGAIASMEFVPLWDRILTAFKAIAFYLLKMIWPIDLAPLYPLPLKISIYDPQQIVSIIVFLSITIFSINRLKKKNEKIWFAIWAYFLITLVPVLGIIQVGAQAAADRYTYLPSLGPFLLAGSGVAVLYERSTQNVPAKRIWATIPLTIIIVITIFFSTLTIKQEKIWKDTMTLWNSELQIFPNSAYIAYYNRGNEFLSLHDYPNAVEDYKKAILIMPSFILSYYNLGNAYRSMGLLDQAMEQYSQTVHLDPDHADAHNNLGISYFNKGLVDKSIVHFRKAVEIKPFNADFHINLGNAYGEKGLNKQAFQEMQKGFQLRR